MVLDLNRDWIFDKGDGKPTLVTLPHDAMLTEKRYAACRSGVGSGYFSGGKYRYQRSFAIGESDIDKHIELLFEGVYRHVSVFLNSEQVAYHAYGFSAFGVDLSGRVKAGENLLMVEVDNSLVPNCRWYSGAGIYRPVWLMIREKIHITDITVKTLSTDPAVVAISAQATEDAPITVELSYGGKIVAKGAPGKFTIPGAKLWTAETPHLYHLTVSCGPDREELDFGIRTLTWSGEKGLLVNDRCVKLRGGCIHSDNGILGACEYPDAAERRVRILREQGFNALRMAHNAASRALLDACDRLGMYVIDECFDGWYIPKDYHDHSRDFYKTYRDDLAAMVRMDKNRPSVIMYSLGNEVTETASHRGIALLAEMHAFVKSLDDTRPTTCGINVLLDVYAKLGIGVYRDKDEYSPTPLPEGRGYREKKAGSAFFNAFANKLGGLMFFMSKGRLAEKMTARIAPAVDILGLNYASSRYDTDAEKYPARLMVGAETMVGDLPYNWARVEKYPQLVGDFVWAAWDYLGEACIGDWTYHSYKGLPLLAGQGMIDITGKPLASMAYMQIVWGIRTSPFIGVRPLNHAGETPSTGAWQFTNAIDSWSWQGYEGKKATVEVFAKAASVRLILNGKTVAVKRVKKYKTRFRLSYQPGQLVAEALDEAGRVMASSALVSADDETVLTAKPEKGTIPIGGLCYLPVEFTDRKGNLKPFIEQRVEIEVSGAKLLGFGSALCKTDEVFDKTYHDSYRGRCLAVIQAQEAGMATVTFRAQGIAPATAGINILAKENK